MADIDDVDLDDARMYLESLNARFEREDLEELEREAADGFVEKEAGTLDELNADVSRTTTRTKLLCCRMLLDRIEGGRADRSDELGFLQRLTQLRREFPAPDEQAWREFLAEHPELDPEPQLPRWPTVAEQLAHAHTRISSLEKELRVERKANMPDDDRVLAAFRAVASAGEPTSATSIGEELFGDRLNHGFKCRIGVALGRLEKRGLVKRVRRSEWDSYRWEVVDA